MIIHANNKISIDFNDSDRVKGPGVSVQNATDGSIPHVGIEYTRDCAVQKDMENSIVYTDANDNKKRVVEEVAENLPAEEFDPADFISKSMTGKDAKAVEDEGSILEEYVAGSLERAIERVKGQRQEQEEAIGRQVEKQEEAQEFFGEMEERIQEAVQMAANLPGISEAAAKYFLDNHLPFSPQNIKNCGSVMEPATYNQDRAAFEEMKPQIEAAVINSGLEAGEENLEAAKWLYEHDVPVTGENICAYETLRELEGVSSDVLAERIEDAVMDGITPEGADLTVPSRREVSERLSRLCETDDDTLRTVYWTEADLIRAKRQLEEIRLTMTIDAARTMESKGIHLEVGNLMEIVEELKAMEQAAAQEMLTAAGVPADEENIEIAVTALQAGRDILRAPVSVLGETIAAADEDTIVDLAAAGNDARSRLAAAESYEAVGTEVRRDLGDSIQKAFSHVGSLLKEMGLPATAANERAVRILAYNRMPVTEENIRSMKEYDDKVTSIAKGLKPEVVTELIRRRENPLEMDLNELDEKISEIRAELSSEDISFRKYLWKLDHSGAVTPEERKSMIGIYRLLDKVEKSDGAVIGQVIKDGRELSFSSLLSAVRSRKAQGIDQSVDDDFGGLEQVVKSGESISEQIGAAFASHVAANLQKELSPAVLKKKKDTFMEEPLEVILDECLSETEALREEAGYYEQAASEVREMAAESDAQVLEFLKQLEIPDSIINIHWMKSYLERGGRSFLKLYSKEESEKIVDALDDPEKLQEVYEEIDGAHEEQLAERKAEPDVSYEDVKEIARMASGVSFYRQMRSFQKYEVPIYTEQGMTACSITVKQGRGSEKGTVEITMDLPGKKDPAGSTQATPVQATPMQAMPVQATPIQATSIQATFKVAGNRVSGFVTSEDKEALRVCGDMFTQFEKDLEMNGFTMERGDFANGRRNSFHLGNRFDETAANDRLYLVAKLFIQNVQRKDEQQ